MAYSDEEFETLWQALTAPGALGTGGGVGAWCPPDVSEREAIGEALRQLSQGLAEREDWPEAAGGLKSELLTRTAAAGLDPAALVPLAGSQDDAAAELLIDMVGVCSDAWAEGMEVGVSDWTTAKEGLVLAALALENGPLVTRWEAGESAAAEVWDETLVALGRGMAQMLRLRDLLGCTETVFGVGNGASFWRRCIATLFEVMASGPSGGEDGNGDGSAA